MLGSVGAKIAHASTITALGNPDLRTLQDLITAEKGVLVGVQRLAGEIGKSAETLKTWGLGEGDDLGDVLSHSTNLLAQFSAALTQYASYEEQIRTQMKSIRSREEDLDEMKRRKRNVDNKADGADKKLAKMSPEHKSRMAQVELLNELKEEGRRLEIDIVNEEAAIGDYKRRATREFLGLKFAGMVELAEKTTVRVLLFYSHNNPNPHNRLSATSGTNPLYTTPPGQPRPLYTSREKTAELSSEAMRCIGEVRINPPVLPEPTPATTTFQPFNHYNNSGPATPGTDHVNGVTGSTMPRGPNNFNEFGESQYSGPGGSGFTTGSLRIGEDGSRVGNTGAGEFHTLPARTSGFGSGLPPITLGDHGRDDTFSSSIADALSHDPTFSPQHAPTPPPHEPPQSSHQPPLRSEPTPHHLAPLPAHTSPANYPSLHPPPDAEGQVAGFTHERDISPPPVFHPPAPPAPPVPSTSPPPVSHTIQAPSPPPVLAMPASPVPAPAAPATPPAPPAANQPQPIPYADSFRDLSPSPPPVRDPSPAPAPRLDQHEASNPLVREESHEDIFAMYGSSNRNSAASPPPPPQPQSPSNKPSLGVISAPTDVLPPRTPSPPHIQTQESNYGTPSEYPNPFSSPLPRPPTLPTLSNVSPVTSPTSPGGSGRMISAGAFRRNVSRSDTLDPGSSLPPPVSPLSVRKKGLGGSEDISRVILLFLHLRELPQFIQRLTEKARVWEGVRAPLPVDLAGFQSTSELSEIPEIPQVVNYTFLRDAALDNKRESESGKFPLSYDNNSSTIASARGRPRRQQAHGHTNGINSVTVSPDGTLVASASEDGTMRVWRSSDGSLAAGPFIGHTESICMECEGGEALPVFSEDTLLKITSLGFSSGGIHVLAGSDNSGMQVWGVEDGTPQPVSSNMQLSSRTTCATSPDGLYTGFDDGTTLGVSLLTGQIAFQLCSARDD
ncbi:Eisosome component PIL1 [Rhizoctonia solani]|uniref:Eisosome component PIL1 n=1 Tax=Rhizoctonia solani TaxID=456999 RepID=A0A8H7M039_9AGAM|nr:Eisosome component PIL1 [Rhizoctonia solani]